MPETRVPRLQSIRLRGFRSFETEQELRLAQPNGEAGSGLTMVVGANNAGKSTLIEALRAFSSPRPPPFDVGRRNSRAGDRVELTLVNADGQARTVATVRGSESKLNPPAYLPEYAQIVVVQSRRIFGGNFPEPSPTDRLNQSQQLRPLERAAALGQFPGRLKHAEQDATRKAALDGIVQELLGQTFEWWFDRDESGRSHIRVNDQGISHISDGLGEGLISLFVIADALYETTEEDIIVIDEPEASLHPQVQRRLMALLERFAATRQIVISTHSPYFVSWRSIENGGTLARLAKHEGRSTISQTGDEAAVAVRKITRDKTNPHTLGLDASEVVFQSDGVIVVEGQDDVVHYRRLFDVRGNRLSERLFGWGAGGASRIELVLTILTSLGFRNISVMLDKSDDGRAEALPSRFQGIAVETIPAPDVRDKDEQKPRPAVEGLVGSDGNVRPAYSSDFSAIVERLSNRLL